VISHRILSGVRLCDRVRLAGRPLYCLVLRGHVLLRLRPEDPNDRMIPFRGTAARVRGVWHRCDTKLNVGEVVTCPESS
jgi:hypothetical protein